MTQGMIASLTIYYYTYFLLLKKSQQYSANLDYDIETILDSYLMNQDALKIWHLHDPFSLLL